jgi:hypothetical protein
LTVSVLVGAALPAVVALLVITATTRPATGTEYGIATAGGNEGASEVIATCAADVVPCPTGELWLAPQYLSHAFVSFRRQVLDPGGFMRLWIPYDALSSWDSRSGDCGWSRYAFGRPARFNALDGVQVFDRLVWDVQGARALGLTPEVVFSAGSGEGPPSYPQPGYGEGSRPFAGVTAAGRDYYCGVLGVMSWLRADLRGLAPTHWEAFNEPDAYRSYAGPHGVLEAAELWELAQSAGERVGSEQVAALSITDPQSGYAADYIRQLAGGSVCAAGLEPFPIACEFPRYWAVHDYADPTAGGTADLQAFEDTLSVLTRRSRLLDDPLAVWVTESAVEPGLQTDADRNHGGCAGSEPDNRGSLGACVDDSLAAQRRGARAWRSLARVSAPGVRTTQLYWFEFQLIPSWDSALLDAEGKPRPVFCALVRGAVCDGNPRDYLLDSRR